MTPTLALRAAYTRLDAQYESDGSVNSNRVKSGNTMPGIPKQKFFGELAWRSVGWINKPTQGFSEAGFEINAVGEMYADSLNTAKVEAYETYNLRAAHHIKSGQQTLSFYGRLDNITDQKYVSSVVVDQSSSRFYEPGAPRNWLLGVKYTIQM